MKNPAFDEEKEWRLISVGPKNTRGELGLFGYRGLSYRANHLHIAPYLPFELGEGFTEAIKEVWLGPRNITPEIIVEEFLNDHGITNVKILRSRASYR
jgi:hypothetical protein